MGTVALSLGASFGLSVLVWQYLLGIQLHWLVLAMSVIVLLAVGSDYNLLLVSRMKEEIGAGINTGIIRAMGGTGKVVTAAGLVFAFTMASMVVSDLRVIGQVGTTIGLGLLFDTLVVRAFMTPSIAALLGRWFWWPQRDNGEKGGRRGIGHDQAVPRDSITRSGQFPARDRANIVGGSRSPPPQPASACAITSPTVSAPRSSSSSYCITEIKTGRRSALIVPPPYVISVTSAAL